jgi:hypothetical protein
MVVDTKRLSPAAIEGVRKTGWQDIELEALIELARIKTEYRTQNTDIKMNENLGKMEF